MSGKRPSADATSSFCYTAATFIYGIIIYLEAETHSTNATAPPASIDAMGYEAHGSPPTNWRFDDCSG